MNIEKLLNNPNFEINLPKLLLTVLSENILTKNYIKELIEIQIELIEIQKGKIGQELNDAVVEKLEKINYLVEKNTRENYLKVCSDLTSD